MQKKWGGGNWPYCSFLPPDLISFGVLVSLKRSIIIFFSNCAPLDKVKSGVKFTNKFDSCRSVAANDMFHGYNDQGQVVSQACLGHFFMHTIWHRLMPV